MPFEWRSSDVLDGCAGRAVVAVPEEAVERFGSWCRTGGPREPPPTSRRSDALLRPAVSRRLPVRLRPTVGEVLAAFERRANDRDRSNGGPPTTPEASPTAGPALAPPVRSFGAWLPRTTVEWRFGPTADDQRFDYVDASEGNPLLPGGRSRGSHRSSDRRTRCRPTGFVSTGTSPTSS